MSFTAKDLVKCFEQGVTTPYGDPSVRMWLLLGNGQIRPAALPLPDAGVFAAYLPVAGTTRLVYRTAGADRLVGTALRYSRGQWSTVRDCVLSCCTRWGTDSCGKVIYGFGDTPHPFDYATGLPVDLDSVGDLRPVMDCDGSAVGHTVADDEFEVDSVWYHRVGNAWHDDGSVVWNVDLQEYALESNCYYWHDGEYHSVPEPDDDDTSGIPNYHSRHRDYGRIPPMALGVELECDYGDRSSCADMVSDAENQGWIAERDGSLDDDSGLELVLPPATLAQWRDGLASRVTATIRDNGGTVPNSSHGLHVSINAEYADGSPWTALHCQKFAAWWTINSDVVTLLARRDANTYAVRSHDKPGVYLPTSHYDACAFRDACGRPLRGYSIGRVEVRVFRSTNTASRLRACIQLVHAVACWTRECPLGNTAGSEAYMSIGDQMSFWRFVRANRRDYPDLEPYALDCGVPIHDYVPVLRKKPDHIQPPVEVN